MSDCVEPVGDAVMRATVLPLFVELGYCTTSSELTAHTVANGAIYIPIKTIMLALYLHYQQTAYVVHTL